MAPNAKAPRATLAIAIRLVPAIAASGQ